jgi:hypothetical protein
VREDDAHERLLAREAVASALYLALVLFAAMVVTPDDRFPGDAEAVRLLLGTAVGLVAAHWLAFRLAARLTDVHGAWTPTAAQEAGAQVLGALAVAAMASVPFLVLDGLPAQRASLVVLAALPAVAGVLIGRLNGRSWASALMTASLALVVAAVVVTVKTAVSH